MKQNLKIILLLLFAGSMLLLQSCEKDLFEEPVKDRIITKRMSYNEINQKQRLIAKIESLSKVKVDNFNKMVYDSIKNVYIDLDNVVYSRTENFVESYTFKIIRDDNQKLENLILTEKEDGSIQTTLIKYNQINFSGSQTSLDVVKQELKQIMEVYNVQNNDLYNNLQKVQADCLDYVVVEHITPGTPCLSTQHEFEDGDLCDYWGTINMATPTVTEYELELQWVDCGGGGGSQNISTSPTAGSDGDIGNGNDPPTPCDLLKSLTDDAQITAGINFLKGKIHASSEFGYEIDRNLNYDGDNVYATVFQAGSAFGVEIEYGANAIGGMHNHPKNGQAIPSWGDLRWLMLCDTADRYHRNDGYSVNIVVVRDPANPNAPATIYGITIDNIDLLSQEINAVWETIPFNREPDVKKRLDAINADFADKFIDVQNDKEQLEVRFLSIFRNYGISLNRLNNDTRKWEKLALHNPYNPNNPNQANSIDAIPCPN